MNRTLKKFIAIGAAAVITAVCVSGCTTYEISDNTNSSNPFGQIIKPDSASSSENSAPDETTKPAVTMYFDSSSSDDTMTMPNIIGMTLDEIGSKYPDLNLEIERQYSDEYAENTVIDQKTPAGRTIRKSAVVNITVSNGTQKIEIPDLSGINIEEAMDKLEKMELVPKMIYVDNDETDKDAVIYTEPAAHSEVAKNTLVKLYVSKGKPTAAVNVPRFVGMTIEEAQKEAENVGLILNVKTEASDEYESGTVINQSIEENSVVYTNTEIEVTVCE